MIFLGQILNAGWINFESENQTNIWTICTFFRVWNMLKMMPTLSQSSPFSQTSSSSPVSRSLTSLRTANVILIVNTLSSWCWWYNLVITLGDYGICNCNELLPMKSFAQQRAAEPTSNFYNIKCQWWSSWQKC